MGIQKLRYRFQERLLIRGLPFERLVREIAQDYVLAPIFQTQAKEALRYPAESHQINLFEDTNLLAGHAKRVTVHDFDLGLVRHITVYARLLYPPV